MQKFLNTLPLLAIAALTWFHFFHQPNNDKPKLAKHLSETQSLRCEVVKDSIYDGDTFRFELVAGTYERAKGYLERFKSAAQ